MLDGFDDGALLITRKLDRPNHGYFGTELDKLRNWCSANKMSASVWLTVG
jgi:hypothetical protein